MKALLIALLLLAQYDRTVPEPSYPPDYDGTGVWLPPRGIYPQDPSPYKGPQTLEQICGDGDYFGTATWRHYCLGEQGGYPLHYGNGRR